MIEKNLVYVDFLKMAHDINISKKNTIKTKIVSICRNEKCGNNGKIALRSYNKPCGMCRVMPTFYQVVIKEGTKRLIEIIYVEPKPRKKRVKNQKIYKPYQRLPRSQFKFEILKRSRLEDLKSLQFSTKELTAKWGIVNDSKTRRWIRRYHPLYSKYHISEFVLRAKEKEKRITALHMEGKSVKEIVKMTGINLHTVNNVRVRLGLKPKTVMDREKRFKDLEGDYSLEELIIRWNINNMMIYNWMHKHAPDRLSDYFTPKKRRRNKRKKEEST